MKWIIMLKSPNLMSENQINNEINHLESTLDKIVGKIDKLKKIRTQEIKKSTNLKRDLVKLEDKIYKSNAKISDLNAEIGSNIQVRTTNAYDKRIKSLKKHLRTINTTADLTKFLN